jgi:FkbH-like protein
MPEIASGADSLASVLDAVASFESQGRATDVASVRVLRNYTADAIVPQLQYFLYKAGVRPDVMLGGYDTFVQDAIALGENGSAAPDVVLVTLVLEYLDPRSQSTRWDPEPARAAIHGTLERLVTHTPSTVVIQTLLPPDVTEDRFGAFRDDHRIAKVEAINRGIVDLARDHPRRIFPIEAQRIVERLGVASALDPRFAARCRAPFTRAFLAALARDAAAVTALLKGRMKKCLVLDCDGTLWGGVVAEDGLNGIQLHADDYPGRCYQQLQRAVLNLIDCGVTVALCSKNDPADVFAVLDRHPHCLLKREHLSSWRIDWRPKHESVLALADELNLSPDAMVFVDDNPIECETTAAMVPELTVVRVPGEPCQLPSLLYRDGLFDTLGVGEVDADRTRLYREDRARKTAAVQCHDRTAYLSSLDLRASVRRADPASVRRIAQLMARTNQFNVTTRRYSEGAIAALVDRDDRAVFCMSAADRFGDLGDVAVLVAERRGDEGVIDSLLLSCRALGRDLEFAFVDRCLELLDRDWRAAAWNATFIPTARNDQVATFWSACGFTTTAATEAMTTYRVVARDRPRLTPSFIAMDGR